jgi:hypothetical protein
MATVVCRNCSRELTQEEITGSTNVGYCFDCSVERGGQDPGEPAEPEEQRHESLPARRRTPVGRKVSKRLATAPENDFEYRLLNVQRAESKTDEVEDIINDQADEGWRVAGYSAQGWRGVMQAGFSHLVLFERPYVDDEEDGEETTHE